MTDPAKKKVALIVEDEVPLLSAVKTKLEENGFDTVSSRSSEEAYRFLGDVGNIDFIWLDHYLLGRETGVDFIKKVKQDERFGGVPIFVVSNTVTPDTVKEYLSLGVMKFYPKVELSLSDIVSDIKSQLVGSRSS